MSLNLSIHIHTLIECFGKFQHLGAIAFEGCVGGWTKTMHITDEMAADDVAFPGLHTISVNGDILAKELASISRTLKTGCGIDTTATLG